MPNIARSYIRSVRVGFFWFNEDLVLTTGIAYYSNSNTNIARSKVSLLDGMPLNNTSVPHIARPYIRSVTLTVGFFWFYKDLVLTTGTAYYSNTDTARS